MSDQQNPDAVETEPGTEDQETVVETAPAQPGDQPADVALADGSKPPVGEDGNPVLTDDSVPPPDDPNAGSDDESDEDDEEPEADTRILGYSASPGFRGIMAKRAERMRNRPLGSYGTIATDEPAEDHEEPSEDKGFDPSDSTVADVQAYLAENPDQTGYVLDRERAGKARVTLLGD